MLSWLTKYDYEVTTQWHILLKLNNNDKCKNDYKIVDEKRYVSRSRREDRIYMDNGDRNDEDRDKEENEEDNNNNYKYCSICLSKPGEGQVLILKLLATATDHELKEHFRQVLKYTSNFVKPNVWVINFTCTDNVISNPYWQSQKQLSLSLNVIHIWHNENFKIVKIIFNHSTIFEELKLL